MFNFLKKKKKPIGALTDEDLKTLDVIILVDHSGSMGIESHRCLGANRLGEVQQNVFDTAQVAEKFDSDGLTVIPFSSGVQVFDKVGSLNVASVFKAFKPDGSTNLTAALEAAVAKAEVSPKNVVVLVYTDGRPDSMTSAKLVIEQAGRDMGRPKIGFTFVQVGDDSAARAFLDELDTQMTIDLCATVRAEDAINLTFHQLAWLAQNA